MTPASISLFTEDGASNNKASAKELKAPFKVCGPHDLQRAVLLAVGEAGSVSQKAEVLHWAGLLDGRCAPPLHQD